MEIILVSIFVLLQIALVGYGKQKFSLFGFVESIGYKQKAYLFGELIFKGSLMAANLLVFFAILKADDHFRDIQIIGFSFVLWVLFSVFRAKFIQKKGWFYLGDGLVIFDEKMNPQDNISDSIMFKIVQILFRLAVLSVGFLLMLKF